MFTSLFERARESWSRPRKPGADRIALLLVVVLGLGSLWSWRYHFFFANYGDFVTEQVLPALGRSDLVQRAVSVHGSLGGVSELRLDRWPLTSPYFRNYNTTHDRLNPVGSDYLGVWHYVREMLRGHDPYAFGLDYFTYNQYAGRWPMVVDRTVPSQHVGAFSYFPGALLVLLPFYNGSYFVSFFIYLASLHLFLIAGAVVAVRRTRSAALPLSMVFTVLFFSCFPLGLLVDRGNTEGVPLMLVASAIYAYRRERFHLAAVLLGVAASAKLFPAIFLALFVLDRRWRALATGIAAGVAATLGTMLCLHAPVRTVMHELLSHLSGFNRYFLFDDNSVRFNHTFFNLIKGTLFCDLYNRHPTAGLELWGRMYPWLVLVLTLGMLWRLRRLPFDQRVLCLCVAMLAFPFISFDYTLVHLLVPFTIFLTAVMRRPQVSLRALAPVFVMAFLFVPKEYLVELYARRWGIGFACNAIALGVLLVLGLFPAKEDRDDGPAVAEAAASSTDPEPA
ncbi:MAG TPA: glycosyltransferase family 87 protein [Polyangiales bacterium]